jgi:His-Xaa-Ser system protein HxsD
VLGVSVVRCSFGDDGEARTMDNRPLPVTLHSLDFDASCHSADAIQRAAYVFTDRFSLTLTGGEGLWHCVLEFASEENIPETLQAFRIEVLDYVLRERIRAETGPIRNAILALAFSQVDTDAGNAIP